MDKLKFAFEWARERSRAVFETPSDRCFYALMTLCVLVVVTSIWR